MLMHVAPVAARVVVAARYEERMHRALRNEAVVGCGRVAAGEWTWACRNAACREQGVGNVMRCKRCGKPVMPALAYN